MITRSGIVIACLLAGSAAAYAAEGPRRFGLFVGSNGAPEDREPLRHAEADAARLRQVFLELGGMAPEDAVLLEGPDAATIQRSIAAAAARAREAEGALFVFYYSGHADDRALLLGESELPMDELTAALESVPAQLALHVLDACRSGTLTRLKGATAGAPFSVRARPAGEGRVVIASSAEWEDAQESDRLGGSFFTVHLASGLRGPADGDGDGEITLGEAYSYVYARTVESTRATFAGAQHPTYRYDVRGRGELVLTWPGAGLESATLELSGGGDWLVLDAGSGRVAIEARPRSGGEKVALRPGTYRLSKRTDSASWDGEVRLSPRDRVTADDHLTRRTEHARLVRKGSTGAPFASHALLLGGGVRGPLANGIEAQPFLRASYALALPWLTLLPRAAFSPPALATRTPRLSFESSEVSAGLELRRAQDIGPLTASAGLVFDVAWLTQREREGREPARDAVGFVAGAALALEVAPVHGLLVTIGAELDAYSFPVSEATRAPASDGKLETVLTYRALAAVGWEL